MAVPLFDLVLGEDHSDSLMPVDGYSSTLRSRNDRAMHYLTSGRPAKAVPLYERTLADCKRILGASHPYTLRAGNNLAMGYRAAGRTADAIPLLERTLADCKRILGAGHPDTKAARANLAALTPAQKRD